jgi:hypothetical protein
MRKWFVTKLPIRELINMIKELFFAAALMLAPCAALAANPGANLSVQVTPAGVSTSGQCSSAPAEAAQAGFTTMALCNDFTQPIPNTAGTGLPSNTSGNCYGGSGCWLGCPNPSGGAGDTYPHVWYSPEPDKYTAPPCNESGAGIQQVTDPTYGNLALDVAYSKADGSSWTWQTMATVSAAVTNLSTQQTLFSDYPTASFYQIVARDNGYTCQAPFGTGCNYSNIQPNVDFFNWTAVGWDGQCYSNGSYICSPLEFDNIENWGNYANGSAIHNWPIGGNCSASPSQCTSAWAGTSTNFFDVTKYHVFGMLKTTNGTSDIKTCAYIDHVLKGCQSIPADSVAACGTQLDNSGTYCQRDALAVWSDSFNNYPIGSGVLPVQLNYWIESIQVWSCADWQRGSTGPNPHCTGPTLVTNSDGSQTYTVTTQ